MAGDSAAVVADRGSSPLLTAVTVAEPRAGEVLVAIMASGVCPTDLFAINGGGGFPFPAVFGHEGAGIVEAVGEGVERVRPGDHVVLSFDSCGACPPCASGHPAYCREFAGRNYSPVTGLVHAAETGGAVNTGWMGQSSWASRVLARESNTVPIDPAMPWPLAAPLGCSVLTGAGTVFNVLRAERGQGLLVIGAGAVGLAAVAAAAWAGCDPIVVSEPLPARRELALRMGATDALAPAEIAGRLRGPAQLDLAIDTVGSQSSSDDALNALAVRGVCATVALAAGRNTVSVSQSTLLWGRTITGVIEGDSVITRDIPRLVTMWQSGGLPLELLVTSYPFERVAEAVQDARSGAAVKAVLVWPEPERRGRPDAAGTAAVSTIESLRSGIRPSGQPHDAASVAALWDTLETVETSELRGLWSGWAVPTGHRMQRALKRAHWHGKYFAADDDVVPLVCRSDDGSLVAAEVRGGGGAALWSVVYRGRATAAMVYDARPVVDHFVRLGPDAVLGVMNGRDVLDGGASFFFVLERDTESAFLHTPRHR